MVRKILFTVFAMLAFTAYAQERILLDAANVSQAKFESQDISTTNSADEWTVEFPNQGVAKGAYRYSITKTSDRGIAMKVEIHGAVPEYVSAVLKPNIIAALTESESGNGKITNVGSVKSVSISGWSLNYDLTVRANMEMSDKRPVGMARLRPQQYGTFELNWENPGYIDDVKKRDIKPQPVYPNVKSDLYLTGVEIRGKPIKAEDGTGYMIVYIDKIKVVADKAYEELDPVSEELFGLESNSTGKYVRQQTLLLEKKQRERAAEQAKMATTGEE